MQLRTLPNTSQYRRPPLRTYVLLVVAEIDRRVRAPEQTFRAARAPVHATICNDARNALKSCPQNGNMFWYHILL